MQPSLSGHLTFQPSPTTHHVDCAKVHQNAGQNSTWILSIMGLNAIPKRSALPIAAIDQNGLSQQVYGRLKNAILFSDHSLATDTVFAEVHLVSCRNVLIYFDRELQDRAVWISTFSDASSALSAIRFSSTSSTTRQ